MLKKMIQVSLAVVAMINTTHVQAAIIDFEDVIVSGGALAINPVQSNGFLFNASAQTSGVMRDPFVCSPDCADNGTQTYYAGGGTSTVTIMTEALGQIFSLTSFDIAEMFSGSPAIGATEINVLGNLSGGGTVSALFSLDGINDSVGGAADFETFLLPSSFTGLTSVHFTATINDFTTNSGYMLDNISASAVPIPAALPLLLSGLAGLGLIGRRRKTA